MPIYGLGILKPPRLRESRFPIDIKYSQINLAHYC